MVNAGPNDNQSQFFFTLGATVELNGKHTIFCKVLLCCKMGSPFDLQKKLIDLHLDSPGPQFIIKSYDLLDYHLLNDNSQQHFLG